jgi:prevent-host-death family protein
MVDLNDTHSLTDFQRRTEDYVRQIQETKRPLVLTIHGKAALVVQDAEAYQAMLDRVERAETVEAIREAMREFDEGKGVTLEEFKEEVRRRHGIPL